jgi:UMF1 family MFS transporter
MKPDRQVVAWAFYDWANSAFATTVMAGFFPIFFKEFWATGTASESTFQLGMTNSLASLAIMLTAPLLGALADQGGRRKKFLFVLAAMGVGATGALFWVPAGHWEAALLLYGLAVVGFLGGNIFYDSLIVDVAREHERDWVSALGFALGYLGGGLLFALNVAMTLRPAWFGLASAQEAVQTSFLLVAAWWAIFSLPLAVAVREPRRKTSGSSGHFAAALRELSHTVRSLRQLRRISLFLLAYWLYIDGVDTIVFMAVDYGISLGLKPTSLITALLITQFVGFPAAIAFGKIGERVGAKKGIMAGLFVYIMVILWAYRMQSESEFYGLAVAIGLVQGGVQALSRSLYSRLIPATHAAEFFGLYNMMGKFAAVLGPALIGAVSLLTQDPRTSILALTVLFIAGSICLAFVNTDPSPPQEHERPSL